MSKTGWILICTWLGLCDLECLVSNVKVTNSYQLTSEGVPDTCTMGAGTIISPFSGLLVLLHHPQSTIHLLHHVTIRVLLPLRACLRHRQRHILALELVRLIHDVDIKPLAGMPMSSLVTCRHIEIASCLGR